MCGEGLERLSLAVSFRSGHSHIIWGTHLLEGCETNNKTFFEGGGRGYETKIFYMKI